MTIDERERERDALLAEVRSGRPVSAEVKRRIAALAAADLAQPLDPLGEAFVEVLAETVALSDRTLPPGLDVRVTGDIVEIDYAIERSKAEILQDNHATYHISGSARVLPPLHPWRRR